jgi:hypothetical protein
MVTLYRNHLETKRGPFAPRREVYYEEVSDLDVLGPKTVYLVVTDRLVRLPTESLSSFDRERLLSELKTRIEHSR